MQHHKYPSECCLSNIIRELMNKPYPYQYDYEVDPSNEMKKIRLLLSHFKQAFCNTKSPNYRLLQSKVRDGVTFSTERVSFNSENSKGGTKYQTANLASCSRSKHNSTVSLYNETIPALSVNRSSIKITVSSRQPEKMEKLKINKIIFHSSSKNVEDNNNKPITQSSNRMNKNEDSSTFKSSEINIDQSDDMLI